MIDWKKARKDYKKLNIPDYLYNPCREPLEKAKEETELTDFTTSTLDTLTEAVNKLTWDLYEEKTFDSWHRDAPNGYNL